MALKNPHSIDTSKFLDEITINQMLSDMEQDDLLNTKSIYVQDTEGSIKCVTFSKTHAAYLKAHPKVNPKNYLANIKTMIRKRI
jgi:hypothetical protein